MKTSRGNLLLEMAIVLAFLTGAGITLYVTVVQPLGHYMQGESIRRKVEAIRQAAEATYGQQVASSQCFTSPAISLTTLLTNHTLASDPSLPGERYSVAYRFTPRGRPVSIEVTLTGNNLASAVNHLSPSSQTTATYVFTSPIAGFEDHIARIDDRLCLR